MARLLRRNHSTATATNLVSVAIATYPQPDPTEATATLHCLRLGVAKFCRLEDGESTREETFIFTRGQQFWDWLATKTSCNRMTRVIADGMATVIACTGLLEAMEKQEWLLDFPGEPKIRVLDDGTSEEHQNGLMVLDDPPIILCLKSQQLQRVILMDIGNYGYTGPKWNAAISSRCCLTISLSANSQPNLLNKLNESASAVLNWFQNLIKYVKENNLGMLRWTISGQAMASFRHRFMSHIIEFHDSESAHKLERDSYYGGLLYAFRVGEIDEPITQYDVNSLYPYVMRNCKFPRKLIRLAEYDSWQSGPPPCDPEISIAEVYLETAQHAYPVRIDGQTVYCRGQFSTTLAGPELFLAAYHGEIKGYKRFTTYELAPLFTGFVDYFWQQRCQFKEAGNAEYANICKLILNSLYGKFAQRGRQMVYRPDLDAPQSWDKWYDLWPGTNKQRVFQSIGWQVFEEQTTDRSPTAFVAISAFCTAYAREHMRSFRSFAGGHNVFYQGIDSLIVNESGAHRLRTGGAVDSKKLGLLKPVCSGLDGQIDGLHKYRIGEKSVCGWHARDSVAIEVNAVSQQELERLPMLVQHKPHGGIKTYRLLKTDSGKIRHGVVKPDGWVEPLYVERPSPLPLSPTAAPSAKDCAISSAKLSID